MSDVNANVFNELVRQNKTNMMTESMATILKAMVAFNKTSTMSVFSKNRPRSRQDIEFLDEMSGPVLSNHEVDRIKQAITRLTFVDGSMATRSIYTAAEIAVMTEEQLKTVKKCFAFVTATTYGKDYLKELIKLELVYDYVKRNAPDEPWAVYFATRLFRCVQDTRHMYLTTGAELGIYSRALAVYCDFITDVDAVIASVSTSGVARKRDVEYSEERSRQGVMEMVNLFLSLPRKTQKKLLDKLDIKDGITVHEQLVLQILRAYYVVFNSDTVKVDQI